MAKTSARSKGYRHYKKVARGLTDREKKIMIIGFAVIIIAIICAVAIPEIIERSHLLPMRNGEVQGVGDNWLIRNVGTANSPKYRKIAEVNPIDGYELDHVDAGAIDQQERSYYFAPTGDDSPAQRYYVICGNGEYDELAATSGSQLSGFAKELFYQSEAETDVVDDKNVAYFVIEYSMENSETGDVTYTQTVDLYVESPIDGVCALVIAENTGDSQDVFGDRDAMIELAKSAAAGLVMEK